MTQSNTPKINLRNSVTECAQSLKKENAGKFYNYGIRECAASTQPQRRSKFPTQAL